MPVQEDATAPDATPRDICGGAIAGGAATWGLPQLTAAASKERDARVLNLVLAVEYTEVAFYQEALDQGGLHGELERYARVVLEHEQAHLAFLKQRWAARPTRRHGTVRGQDEGRRAFTAAAVKLEDLAVATYNGQAVNLTPGVVEGGRPDRVRGSPARRVDPQHRRRRAGGRRDR